jgi:hypothetical protein
MNIRKFHITDLPSDRLYILLKKDFHQELFDYIKCYKFKKFNLLFFDNNLNWNTFKRWKSQRTSMPLWFLIEIHNKFIKRFPLKKIEQNIKSYKGPSTSTIINNPNLPLVEDYRLMKIFAHLLGDGHVSGAFGTNLPKGKTHSEYRNFSNDLLDSFRNDLSVFGEISTRFDYKHGHVIIPNSIGYILKHIYKNNFDTFNSRIPKVFYSINKTIIASFIRAFADDEAHVYDNSIEFYSGNRELLKDIKRLTELKFSFKLSVMKINESSGRNPKYSFSILSESLEDYHKLIGFDCPKKSKDLLFAIKRGNNWKKNKKFRSLSNPILQLLEYEFTAKEISRKLFISHVHTLNLLNKLEKKGLIYRERKTLHGAWIWKKYL